MAAVVLFFPGVLRLAKKYTILYTDPPQTTPEIYFVVGHPTKNKTFRKTRAISFITSYFLIEGMPTSTIEPNRTQSKFDLITIFFL